MSGDWRNPSNVGRQTSDVSVAAEQFADDHTGDGAVVAGAKDIVLQLKEQ
jgi:hypothetical protein